MSGEDPDDVLAEVVEYLRRELRAEWTCLDKESGPSLAETREMLDGALVRARAVVIRRSRTGVATWRVRLQLF